jgi:hypothetical protein
MVNGWLYRLRVHLAQTSMKHEVSSSVLVGGFYPTVKVRMRVKVCDDIWFSQKMSLFNDQKSLGSVSKGY